MFFIVLNQRYSVLNLLSHHHVQKGMYGNPFLLLFLPGCVQIKRLSYSRESDACTLTLITMPCARDHVPDNCNDIDNDIIASCFPRLYKICFGIYCLGWSNNEIVLIGLLVIGIDLFDVFYC